MRLISDDEAKLAEGLIGFQETGDLTSLFVSRDARIHLDELTSTMTFLEGHADLVADEAGRRHITSVKALRAAFARPPAKRLRMAGTLDKQAQYRDGLAFCRAVLQKSGKQGLRAALASPDNLPSKAEIADPPAWLRRVHG